MTSGVISVLVAEDSAVARMFLVSLLESDPRLRVVGAVADGQAAVDFVATKKVDVVLMDIYMPRLDGFEATRRIMETHPLPIVICSSVADPKAIDTTFRALEAGAVAFIEKPVGREHAQFESTSSRLLDTVRLMSEVKVIRRSGRTKLPRPAPVPTAAKASLQNVRLIGIGASTGGPPVLQTILAGLPKDFPVPILIVQHISRGFLAGMAEWLNQTTPLTIQIASYGTVPVRGHVYLAPDGYQMGIGGDGAISLSSGEAINGLRPSVSFLFRTLAETCGANAIGVLLTGMGRDGADELKMMRDRGAVTIAQDRETSVIYGMPAEAIAIDGATFVLPADSIASTLVALVNERTTHPKELKL